MPRWLRITLTIVVVLLAACGGAYYWFIGDSTPPANVQPFGFEVDPQPRQRFHLNLPHPFARQTDFFTDLFECARRPAMKAETSYQHVSLLVR